MKRIIFCFILLSFFQNTYSQDILLIKQQLDSIASIYKQDSITKPKQIVAIKNDIKLKMWDTINFDPYKYQLKKHPFQIKFTDSVYASPIKGKKVVTSHYGWRRGRPHKGIDIDLVTGDSVLSMLDGIVRFARYSSGHGRTVIIRHFNGLETAYAHLSKYAVKANDTVKKGQVIGKGGISGNARGSHLHLVVSYKGNYINPEYLFDFSNQNKIREQTIWVTKKWTTSLAHTSKKQTKLDALTTQNQAITAQKKEKRKQIHIVKSGDTLSGISNKYSVSLTKLCKTNTLKRTSILKIGQKLVVNRY